MLLLLLLLPFQWCLFVCPFATPPNAQLKHKTQERTRLRVVCILLARFASRRRCCCCAAAAVCAFILFFFCVGRRHAHRSGLAGSFLFLLLGSRNCVLLLLKLLSAFLYFFCLILKILYCLAISSHLINLFKYIQNFNLLAIR